MSKYLDLDDVVADHPIAKAELEKLRGTHGGRRMLTFTTLHLLPQGIEAVVCLDHIDQVVPFEIDHCRIYFTGGNTFEYRESLQEVRAMLNALDVEPFHHVQRPAPSNMGKVESKHGRVTE